MELWVELVGIRLILGEMSEITYGIFDRCRQGLGPYTFSLTF